jgi:hypothetical protein
VRLAGKTSLLQELLREFGEETLAWLLTSPMHRHRIREVSWEAFLGQAADRGTGSSWQPTGAFYLGSRKALFAVEVSSPALIYVRRKSTLSAWQPIRRSKTTKPIVEGIAIVSRLRIRSQLAMPLKSGRRAHHLLA